MSRRLPDRVEHVLRARQDRSVVLDGAAVGLHVLRGAQGAALVVELGSEPVVVSNQTAGPLLLAVDGPHTGVVLAQGAQAMLWLDAQGELRTMRWPERYAT